MGQVNIKPASVIAEEQKEAERKRLKRERDEAFQKIVYEFPDGERMQTRPQDKTNMEVAIQMDIEQKWIMEDNTTRLVTVEELQDALAYGIQQAQLIWQQYADDVDRLFGGS